MSDYFKTRRFSEELNRFGDFVSFLQDYQYNISDLVFYLNESSKFEETVYKHFSFYQPGDKVILNTQFTIDDFSASGWVWALEKGIFKRGNIATVETMSLNSEGSFDLYVVFDCDEHKKTWHFNEKDFVKA